MVYIAIKDIPTLLALLNLQYGLTSESDKIRNPKRNDGKYEKYCKAIIDATEFVKSVKGKMETRDPDFPAYGHLMEIYIPTDDPDLDITSVKGKLANVLNSADEVGISNTSEYIYINLCWNDIYESREL